MYVVTCAPSDETTPSESMLPNNTGKSQQSVDLLFDNVMGEGISFFIPLLVHRCECHDTY